jgi:hypothetical protein
MSPNYILTPTSYFVILINIYNLFSFDLLLIDHIPSSLLTTYPSPAILLSNFQFLSSNVDFDPHQRKWQKAAYQSSKGLFFDHLLVYYISLFKFLKNIRISCNLYFYLQYFIYLYIYKYTYLSYNYINIFI